MDPSRTSDGKPYGPWRFREIIKQAYAISHQIHTSYLDVLDMTPREMNYLCELISVEAERMRNAIDEAKKKASSGKRAR